MMKTRIHRISLEAAATLGFSVVVARREACATSSWPR
jgi:hypothetical protein